jgi:hypothetical protein
MFLEPSKEKGMIDIEIFYWYPELVVTKIVVGRVALQRLVS